MTRREEKPLKRNRTAVGLTIGSAVFVAAFLYFYYAGPSEPLGPEQPIPFSHNVHSGVKEIQCQFCHPYVAYSNFPGIPPVEKCLYCHNYIIAKFPWIQKEHDYFNTATPTPWVKVNYIPEHVFFNHQRHINGKIACEQCHGEVKLSQRLPQKIWRMGMCIECHREKKANVDCWLACHN
jgi:hypothetical protein